MIPPECLLNSASSKREEVKSFLREEARALGGGNKLPTVLELCGTLGVAKATVNSALEELEEEGIVRRRRGSGIFVSEQIARKRIGLVFGENIFEVGRSPVYSMLLNYSRDRALSHGEFFSFYFDEPTAGCEPSVPVHQDLVEALTKKRLHGLLLVSSRGIEQIDWLRAQGVPLVLMTTGGIDSYCVASDYAEIVRLGVRALAEQGCQRIGLISALGLTSQGRGQSTVYLETLAGLGLTGRPEWIWARPDAELSDSKCGEHGEQGYRALLSLLETDPHALDGVVVNDDTMTLGVLAAAKKLGLAVGSDLKIATHANKGSSALLEHESVLTLMEIDPKDFVEEMFGTLERLMAGVSVAPETRLIRPQLRHAGASPISQQTSVPSNK